MLFRQCLSVSPASLCDNEGSISYKLKSCMLTSNLFFRELFSANRLYNFLYYFHIMRTHDSVNEKKGIRIAREHYRTLRFRCPYLISFLKYGMNMAYFTLYIEIMELV